MAINLHWIGTAISSGVSHNGFGAIVSFPTGGGGFPAYGTYNSTLTGVPYLAGTYYVIQSVAYYEQYADYIVKNDGVGGTYTDYATASNIQYNVGNFLYTTNETHDGSSVTLPHGLGTFPTVQYAGYDYTWNGSGGYVQIDYSANFTYSGQIGANDYVNTQSTAGGYYVSVAGSNFLNGKYTYYYITGAGMYGASDYNGSYYSYGTYIWDDGMSTYYWDGNGGYYS